MLRVHSLAILALVAGLTGIRPARAGAPVDSVRVYALDCGTIDFKDMAFFADTGEYDRKPGKLVDVCYLIRHPKGDLLWDLGLGDDLAKQAGGTTNEMGIHTQVDHTLVDQLQALQLQPADIGYVAFSHFHFDHTGNANLFAKATWIVNRRELAWASSTPTPIAVNPTSWSAIKTAKTQLVDLDHDVFGDGTVRILRAPGHTPGHQVLMLTLKKAGTVILSGDLYHTLANERAKRIPVFNDSRADTLASIDRVAKLTANTKARFFVQHAPEDFAAFPKFPLYLH
jgi:N-acyl homoserine lactone hydrolase